MLIYSLKQTNLWRVCFGSRKTLYAIRVQYSKGKISIREKEPFYALFIGT